MSPKTNTLARRSLEAYNRMLSARINNDEWNAWQRAGTEYWVSRHPELSRYLRPDPALTPTVKEIRERGQAVHAAHHHEPTKPDDMVERSAHGAWYHETLAALYEPVGRAIDQLKSGDPAGIETAVRFLEADVYCFRSGYTKQKVIHSLTQHDLPEPAVERLRRVVLNFVDSYDRPEQRSYFRLAHRVDSEGLRTELRARATSDDPGVRRRARWVLEALERR